MSDETLKCTIEEVEPLLAGACLQEQYAPENSCFGCGPSNPKGLRIRSFVNPTGDGLVALFTPAEHHLAFEGVLNGGIIGTLLDCHCNWTALHALMVAKGDDFPPCTVTGDYHIKLRRVTPLGTTLLLRAKAVELGENRAIIEGELEADGKITATCRGTFIAVKESHPAHHRWGSVT